MKGGSVANFMDPLGVIGNAEKCGAIANYVLPLSVRLGTPMHGRATACFAYPLGTVGNAHEGRSHRQICVPSRYDWERR